MFDKMKNQWQQIQMMQKLMKDENFKALISHPKVQAMLQDKDVQEAVKSGDAAKMIGHPKLMALMRDPELAPLLAKLNPQEFLKGMA